MDCPNCGTGHPIITKTNSLPDGDERRRWCPECKYVWWTVECVREQQERQAFQAYLWSAICNHHAGGPSDSAPGTVTGNGAAADGASGAGS